MAKYLVVVVVALGATYLLLARSRQPRNGSAAGKGFRQVVESTARKVAIAVGILLAALAIILVVKHFTS